MTAKRILYISQEIVPYTPAPNTERANVFRYLPQEIQDKKRKEVRLFMPKFGYINERRYQLHEVIRLTGMNIVIDDNDHSLVIKVASIQMARMQVYFIDNDDFFQRKAGWINPKTGEEFEDNEDRIIFFMRGVIEASKKLRWAPDLIHITGWMSALAPIYIKKAYKNDPFFKNPKIIYSLYDDDFKQPFSSKFAEKLMMDGITSEDVESIYGKEVSYVDLMKLALRDCDGVIEGSPNVNPELRPVMESFGDKFLPFVDPMIDTSSDSKKDHKIDSNFVDKYDEFYSKFLD